MVYYSSTQTSIEAYWSKMTGAVSYSIELYRGYSASGSPVDSAYNFGTNSTSVAFYGLSPGTAYYIKFWGRMSNGSNNIEYAQAYTDSPPQIYVGGVGYVSVAAGNGTVTASWSSASNADSYGVELYRGTSSNYGTYISNETIYSTSKTFTGLSDGTYYTVKAYGKRSGSSNGDPSENYTITPSYNVGTLSSITVQGNTSTKGRMDVWWGTATNATSYDVEIFIGNTTNSSYLVERKNLTGGSTFFTGLSEYTWYTVKVYGKRSGYSNGGALTDYKPTADLTSPVVNSISGDGSGKMYLSWTASDSGSGLRSSSTFYTEITNANGTSYGQGAWTTNYYRTFTADAYGNEFVHDAYYYMRVAVYDASGNTITNNVRIQYKRARPTDWTWHTTKTTGTTVNVTAAEWNSFCLRINQFRQYRSQENYTFSTVASGTTIQAWQVNEARNAIAIMNSSVPALQSKGGPATSSFINGLVTALNNIT